MSDEAARYVIARVTRGDGTIYGYHFHCPGCDDIHTVGNSWTFNGSMSAPTFNPSVLVKYGESRPGHRCHSFIKGGNIRFLADCTHDLAGLTLPLPEWTGWPPARRALKEKGNETP